jgi:hypothetical protein
LRHARIILGLAGLLALSAVVFGLVAVTAVDGEAGVWSPPGVSDAGPPVPMATPVKVWRDCQEIALCAGCKTRYKCRSCEYKRTCARGLCSWGDVCVWGPYLKVLPRGARIIKIR